MCWSMFCLCEGQKSVQYCRLIKEHDDDKSGLCVNCYKAKLDQSVTQCRQVLGHKSRDTATVEMLFLWHCSVMPACGSKFVSGSSRKATVAESVLHLCQPKLVTVARCFGCRLGFN